MRIIRQLTIFLENQPGMMAKICTIMKKSDINILAFTIFGTVDHGVLRMIVNNPVPALHALGRVGILVIDSDVIEIAAENRPGILEEITSALSKARVNVDYGYGSTNEKDGEHRFYLQVSDSKKALLVIKNKFLKKTKSVRKAKATKKPPAKKKAPARKKTVRKKK